MGAKVLYCTNLVLYCTALVLYCNALVLYCTACVLYCTAWVFYCTAQMLYCTAQVLYCNVQVFHCTPRVLLHYSYIVLHYSGGVLCCTQHCIGFDCTSIGRTLIIALTNYTYCYFSTGMLQSASMGGREVGREGRMRDWKQGVRSGGMNARKYPGPYNRASITAMG